MAISEIDGYLFDIYKDLRGRTLTFSDDMDEEVYLKLDASDFSPLSDTGLTSCRLHSIEYVSPLLSAYDCDDSGLVCTVEFEGDFCPVRLECLGQDNLLLLKDVVSKAMHAANMRALYVEELKECLNPDGSAFDLRDENGRGVLVKIGGREVELESAFFDMSGSVDYSILLYSLNRPNVRLSELSDDAVWRVCLRSHELGQRKVAQEDLKPRGLKL